MAGVMSSTIGELQIIHARTTPDRLYQYWYQFFVQRPATLVAGWSLQLAILTTTNSLNICTLFLVCYYKYHFIFNIYRRHHHQIVVTITVFIIIIIISSPLSWPLPLPQSS